MPPKSTKTTKTNTAKTAQKTATAPANGVLNGLMGKVADGWRVYNLKQLDFAQKNAEAYFEVSRQALKAKSLSEAMTLYNRFAMGAVSRQMEQARELGSMATKAQQEVGKRIASLRAKSQ